MTTHNDLIPSQAGQWLAELDRDPNLGSAHTRTQYASALRRFERWLGDRPVNVTVVEAYLTHLQELDKSRNTVKLALAAIRWLAGRVIKNAWDTLPREQAAALDQDLRRLDDIRLTKQPKPLPAGRHLTPAEIRALFAACEDGTPPGIAGCCLPGRGRGHRRPQ